MCSSDLGHIAGIVNPPSLKSWYETAESNPADPAQWREDAQRHGGSWWEDWVAWTDARTATSSPRLDGLSARPGAWRGAGRLRPGMTPDGDG